MADMSEAMTARRTAPVPAAATAVGGLRLAPATAETEAVTTA